VLSVKDEFYHRHIVQYDLFAPVFALFRAETATAGDTLVSSAVLEMCDFICLENIKPLIAYIATKHLSQKPGVSFSAASSSDSLSLEVIANPYVDTFTKLLKAYENNMNTTTSRLEHRDGGNNSDAAALVDGNHNNDSVSLNNARGGISILNKKALEDQRKFSEAHEDESYFNDYN